MVEVHSGPGIFQRVGEFPTQTDPEFSVAQEARDFYRNGPSLPDRYLPIWMTNYAKRAIAVLVTVIAIVIPLFSYAPRLYKWLVEYRLRALYRRLRAIEASLQKSVTVPEISALEGDLEILDREIFILGVPIRHSDLYFMIKSHLNLVRSRIWIASQRVAGQKDHDVSFVAVSTDSAAPTLYLTAVELRRQLFIVACLQSICDVTGLTTN